MEPQHYKSLKHGHAFAHWYGRERDDGPQRLADLLLRYEEFGCGEPRDRIIALLSLAQEGVKIDSPYSNTDEDFLLRCCRALNSNLEGMNRMLYAMHIDRGRLVHHVKLRQPIVAASKPIVEQSIYEFVVFDVDALLPPSALQQKCRGCSCRIARVPQTILRRCKVFCLGPMAYCRHLIFLEASAADNSQAASVLFLDDTEHWFEIRDRNEPFFCDDSDSSDNEPRSTFGRTDHAHKNNPRLRFTHPECNGYFSYHFMSNCRARIRISLDLAIHLSHFSLRVTSPIVTRQRANLRQAAELPRAQYREIGLGSDVLRVDFVRMLGVGREEI